MELENDHLSQVGKKSFRISIKIYICGEQNVFNIIHDSGGEYYIRFLFRSESQSPSGDYVSPANVVPKLRYFDVTKVSVR